MSPLWKRRKPEPSMYDGLPPYKYVYASELIDDESCETCRAADEQEWATVDEARELYHEGGGNRGCTSPRGCRGMIVIVLESEQDPST